MISKFNTILCESQLCARHTCVRHYWPNCSQWTLNIFVVWAKRVALSKNTQTLTAIWEWERVGVYVYNVYVPANHTATCICAFFFFYILAWFHLLECSVHVGLCGMCAPVSIGCVLQGCTSDSAAPCRHRIEPEKRVSGEWENERTRQREDPSNEHTSEFQELEPKVETLWWLTHASR